MNTFNLLLCKAFQKLMNTMEYQVYFLIMEEKSQTS